MHSWRCCPYKGASWGMPFNRRPNWFHRLMQKWFFGFHWEKVE